MDNSIIITPRAKTPECAEHDPTQLGKRTNSGGTRSTYLVRRTSSGGTRSKPKH